MKINVLSLIGEMCMTYADGQKLHATYRPAFDAGESVTLDFAGTRIFVSQFFNAAVGQVLEHHTIDEVRQRINFENLPDAGRVPLQRSVENAERYYRDPNYRSALDKVLTTEATAV
jgi:hypothetical protein